MKRRKRPLLTEAAKALAVALHNIRDLEAELDKKPADPHKAAQAWARQLAKKHPSMRSVLNLPAAKEKVRRAWQERERKLFLVRLISAEMRITELCIAITDAERAARADPVRGHNEQKQRVAKAKAKAYRETEKKLFEKHPHLQQASSHRRAVAIRRALLTEGRTAPSVRTIERALKR
jgi:hypothetical protein